VQAQQKAGKGIDLDKGELVETLRLEKDKARQRQLEVLELQQQLERMSLLFWGVSAIGGIAVAICLYLVFLISTKAT
jgi:hypothetical protein